MAELSSQPARRISAFAIRRLRVELMGFVQIAVGVLLSEAALVKFVHSAPLTQGQRGDNTIKYCFGPRDDLNGAAIRRLVG